jgi:hypothetical protein
MKVSKQFLKDFAYLANHYQWTPADVEDVKAYTRENPDMVRYWTALASAHRSGYEQTPENNFIRLQHWCAQSGRTDPFGDDSTKCQGPA